MHVLAIGGPTATGKTSIAVELAHSLGVHVLSADSRQVYRGLDLGTGKDLQEYSKFGPAVPYHLIDIVEPDEVYTLFRYQEDCYRILESLARVAGDASKVAVMAGGTGMYMEAVLRRYRIANVPENAALRADLQSRGREDLESELRESDPELAARTDLSSKKRIIRALVIRDAGGSGSVGLSRLPETEFTQTVFATRMDRVEMRVRIDARLEKRLRDGMIEEVEGLLARGVSNQRLRLLGMEYREIAAYLAGEKSRDAMRDDLRHQIHMLAKRQETYFRGMEKRGVPVLWLEPGKEVRTILDVWNRRGEEYG